MRQGSGGGGQKPGKLAQEGRFAAAIGAAQTKRLARSEAEGDALENRYGTARACQAISPTSRVAAVLQIGKQVVCLGHRNELWHEN
jgi:hypothetical protein